jgi:chromate transporter
MIAMFFTEFKDNEYVIRAFKGIRPAVVALIAVPMLEIIKSTKMKWWSWTIVAFTVVPVCVLKVSPIYILICVILISLAVSYYIDKKRKEDMK